MLNRESILARKLKTKTVPVPEWNGQVVVRALSAPEYLDLVAKLKDDTGRAVYWWIVRATFDETGKRIFADEDVATLEVDQPYTVIERLIEEVLKLNPQKEVAAKN